jgi:hypothetical protein
MQGSPTLELLDEIIAAMTRVDRPVCTRTPTINGMYDICANADFVPTTFPGPAGLGELVVLEDNDAVMDMIMTGRTNRMRDVPRTHRIDLDWLFERILYDPAISIKYVNTKQQIADIFTKGSFTEATWKVLCEMVQIWKTKGDKQGIQKEKEI